MIRIHIQITAQQNEGLASAYDASRYITRGARTTGD